jgi:hypothetical protein
LRGGAGASPARSLESDPGLDHDQFILLQLDDVRVRERTRTKEGPRHTSANRKGPRMEPEQKEGPRHTDAAAQTRRAHRDGGTGERVYLSVGVVGQLASPRLPYDR